MVNGQSKMMDVSDLIGVPFEKGGRGPAAYDCYGLVMELNRRNGVELPDHGAPEGFTAIEEKIQAELKDWQTAPLEAGATLLFNVLGYGAHVGFYLGRDLFIHTWENCGGVLIERLSEWQRRKRLIGSYRYIGGAHV